MVTEVSKGCSYLNPQFSGLSREFEYTQLHFLELKISENGEYPPLCCQFLTKSDCPYRQKVSNFKTLPFRYPGRRFRQATNGS